MGFLDKIKQLFSSFFSSKNNNLIKVSVECNKCNEIVDSVFRKNYDFQPTYGKKHYDYLINKQLVCSGCYQSINLKMEIKNNLEVLTTEISGGKIINDINKHL